MEKTNLINQLTITLKSLDQKLADSPEAVVLTYFNDYRAAIDVLKKSGDKSDVKVHLLKLLNCTRGYLETSSNYQQPFLRDMANSEDAIKEYIEY